MELVSGLTLLTGPRLALPGATGGRRGDNGAGCCMIAAQPLPGLSFWSRSTGACAAAAAATGTSTLCGTSSAAGLASGGAGGAVAGESAALAWSAACLFQLEGWTESDLDATIWQG